jgi:hypothetical protein
MTFLHRTSVRARSLNEIRIYNVGCVEGGIIHLAWLEGQKQAVRRSLKPYRDQDTGPSNRLERLPGNRI